MEPTSKPLTPQPAIEGRPAEGADAQPDAAEKQRRETTSNTTGGPVQLNRQELLNAIDFEISQREGATAKHGINVYGVLAAIVALLWAVINQIADSGHNWTNTLLVFLAGWGFLSYLASIFTKKINWATTIPSVPGRDETFTQVVLLSGVNPDTLPYFMLQFLAALSAYAYLATKGFLLLSVMGCTLYATLLLFLGFCWLLIKIRVPFPLEAPTSPNRAITTLVWAFYFTVIAIAIGSVVQTWPNIAPKDIRLGCILAAFMTVLDFSVVYTRPPIGLSELRSLRSRVAFGLVPLTSAQNEAENILLGPKRENYITTKAEAAVSAFNQSSRLSEGLVHRMRRVICLAEGLQETPGNHLLLEQANSELTGISSRVTTDLKAIKKYISSGNKCRSELEKRVKIGRFLDIPEEQLLAVLRRSEEACKRSESAFAEVSGRSRNFTKAARYLSDLVNEKTSSKGLIMKASELFSTLYRD